MIKQLRKMKYTLICIFLVTTALFIGGCNNESNGKTQEVTQEKKQDSTKFDFLDQNGHEVKLNGTVNRIVCLEHHTLDTLTTLGDQDKVVGVIQQWDKLLGSYMKEVFPGIENLPTPGALDSCNVEEVAKLNPDLVIVAAQFKSEYIKQLEDLGIPVMVVTLHDGGKQEEALSPELNNADLSYTRGMEWVVKKLGEITDKEDRANKLWGFTIANRKYVEDSLKDVPKDKRVRIFIANPNNKTYGSDKYVGCQLERAGATNVAAKEIKGYKQVNFEKIVQWNPDVILVQDRYKGVYDNILKNEKWKNMKAVKDNNIILTPYWTKPWGHPTLGGIAVGELWLAYKFYPDKIKKEEVEKRVKEFYKRFYGVEFKGII